MATLEEIVSLLQINPSTLGGGGAPGTIPGVLGSGTSGFGGPIPPPGIPPNPPPAGPIAPPIGPAPLPPTPGGPIAPPGIPPNPRPGGTTFPTPTPNLRPGGTAVFDPNNIGRGANVPPGIKPPGVGAPGALDSLQGILSGLIPLITQTGFGSDQSPLSTTANIPAVQSQSLPPGSIPNPRPGGTTFPSIPIPDQPTADSTASSLAGPRGFESGLDQAGLVDLQQQLQGLLPPGFSFFPGGFNITGPGLGPTGTLELPTNLTPACLSKAGCKMRSLAACTN